MNVPQTGFAPLDWFLAALNAWGYLITVAFTISENIFIVGSFTPGETVVMAAGFFTVRGSLNPWIVAACSLLGTMTGSNLSYLYGRHGGRKALLKWGSKIFDEDRIRAAEEYFENHGDKTVLVSRFAAGFKNFVPVIAGASHMRLWKFELYTFLGASIYTTLMIVLGRIFADNFDVARKIATNLTWAGFGVLLAMIVFLIWGRHKLISRRVEKLVEEADVEDALEAVLEAAGDRTEARDGAPPVA